MGKILPTKTNLLNLNKTIELSIQGQNLLEKKKYILIKEKDKYKEKEKMLENEVNELKEEAFNLLKKAIINMGIDEIVKLSKEMPLEEKIDIKQKSIMGVEIPSVIIEKKMDIDSLDYTGVEVSTGKTTNSQKTDVVDILNYGLYNTTITLDDSRIKFVELKEKIIELSAIKNTIDRLEEAIEKVRTRANSLKEIIIPEKQREKKEIEETLEERDREEFSRLKMIKNNNYKK